MSWLSRTKHHPVLPKICLTFNIAAIGGWVGLMCCSMNFSGGIFCSNRLVQCSFRLMMLLQPDRSKCVRSSLQMVREDRWGQCSRAWRKANSKLLCPGVLTQLVILKVKYCEGGQECFAGLEGQQKYTSLLFQAYHTTTGSWLRSLTS